MVPGGPFIVQDGPHMVLDGPYIVPDPGFDRCSLHYNEKNYFSYYQQTIVQYHWPSQDGRHDFNSAACRESLVLSSLYIEFNVANQMTKIWNEVRS